MLTSEQAKILRYQQHMADELQAFCSRHGEKHTEIHVSGILVGVVSYLTKHYGTRRAYEAFQQLADCIAEEEISR